MAQKMHCYIAERNFRLFDLARLFGYHPGNLRQVNPHLENYIPKGSSIRLPRKECGERIFYKTFSGQTLLGIADRLGLPPQVLLDCNPGLYLYRFCQGQVLLLPAEESMYKNAHVLEKGVPQCTIGEWLFGSRMSLELLEVLNPGRDILQEGTAGMWKVIDWQTPTAEGDRWQSDAKDMKKV